VSRTLSCFGIFFSILAFFHVLSVWREPLLEEFFTPMYVDSFFFLDLVFWTWSAVALEGAGTLFFFVWGAGFSGFDTLASLFLFHPGFCLN